MLPLILSFLAPVFKKWQTWVLLALAAPVLYILFLRRQLAAAQAVIAARPSVVTKIEEHVKTVIVAGPTQVVTKTIYVPGTQQVAEVDRVVTTGPTTTTTQKAEDVAQSVKPACPVGPKLPTRYVGVSTSPLDPEKAVGVRAGMTVFNRVDVGGGYELVGAGRDRVRVELAWRF